jgi:RNA polymerase sigma-70 factor (ECF subfamily)
VTAAREQILAALRERILAYATSRIGRDQAEDLTQEALLLLEQKYAHLDSLDELLPLSFQIMRFKMNDFRRKASRRGEFNSVDVADLPLSDGKVDILADLERKELKQRLMVALSKLEGRCREMFRLKLQGKTFAEIKIKLGAANINTVYTWDFRCRKLLLEKMQERVQ